MSENNKTVLEVEKKEEKYVGAYYGDEYSFMEMGHNDLPTLLSLFRSEMVDMEDKRVYPGSDGLVVEHTVKTTIPWERVAAVTSNELR